jgi:methionyl aminopeptidase
VPEHIAKPDYFLDGIPRSEQQIRGSSVITPMTDPEDLLNMRKACALTRLVLDTAARALRVGITTDEIDAIVHETTIKHGGYPSPLNYHNFPKSVCTSVNEVICHGIPDRRPLQDGDIVNLDVSVYYNGMHGDMNMTYPVGNVDEAGLKLIESARECLDEAIKQVKPGMRYRDMGDIIQPIAKKNGHSVVRTYCGHGINRLFHCVPNVPHYSKNKAIGYMRPGHTFTIEPMINEGVWKDEHWPDNWTAVTADGKRSAQFEHTLLVTETGVEILTGEGVYHQYFSE